MQETLDYYNQNAKSYAESTKDVLFYETQNAFLAYLQSEAKILDFGCGSGRDSKYFLEHGFSVDAVDGSAEMCRIASNLTGLPVKEMLFQDLNAREEYDGIWACASVLHLTKEELKTVLRKMITALRKNGVLYLSFKYGNFEGQRNGRYFTDFTEASFHDFLKDFPELDFLTEWISNDVRPGRGEEKWLNLILRRVSNN